MIHSSPLLMGLDLGTSSVKTILIDSAGKLIACAAVEYPILTPQPGWAEQDPQVWVTAAMESARQAVLAGGIDGRQVVAIGLSGQMHGTVCLDEEMKPLRNAIIWADQRSSVEVERVYRDIGKQTLGQWTGNPLAVGFMLASLLWLKGNEENTWKRLAHVLLPKDYLRFCLTGRLGSEPSDASSTLLYNTTQRCWNKDLLEYFQIPFQWMPPEGESAAIAGELTAEAAAAIGLPVGIPVVFGGSDQSMQAVGNGVIEPGLVSCTIGTGGQILAPTRKPVYDPDLRLHLFCHALPVCWHLQAATLSAGLSLRWLRDNIFQGKTYQELADAAARTPPGAEGLLFLPHLVGERTPYMDAQSRGAFFGLTLRNSHQHLVRAVMEGVVFSLRQGLDLVQQLGVKAERVVASGGGTLHPLWLQLQADIFNRPIYRTMTMEAAAVGAARLAGVGVGIYPNVESACSSVVRWNETVIQPDSENVSRYEDIFQTFKRLYPAQKSIDIK